MLRQVIWCIGSGVAGVSGGDELCGEARSRGGRGWAGLGGDEDEDEAGSVDDDDDAGDIDVDAIVDGWESGSDLEEEGSVDVSTEASDDEGKSLNDLD